MAVKELVENAVDAGAKVVEIKIKNYGSEGFEVIDNGSGITSDNFAGITAKHHTSKLRDFSDLESIKTFGFRGEALSSLCAVSNVTITTRHATVEHGTKLVYDHDGSIMKKSICARNFGTTVSISDFFTTLPVRRSEFLKNYKKDFAKMVQLIQEYCLVLIGVKIVCTNQSANGARQTVLSTTGSSVKENIISIFGPKQAKDLIEIKSPTDDGSGEGSYTQQSLADLDVSASMTEIKQKDLESLNTARFQIEGFISNIEHHSARSSKDRQYFYINSRPVELRVISKLVNDVYHRYNLKQFPFVYLNLKMDQSNVDVNLSKDKRQVAICNDSILQLAVKRSLLNTYGELPSKFKIVSVNASVKHLQQESESEEGDDSDGDKILAIEPGRKFGESLKQWRKTPMDPTPSQKPTTLKRKSSKGHSTQKIKLFFHQKMKDFEDKNGRHLNTSGSALDVTDQSCQSEDEDEDEEEVSYRIDCKTRKSEHTLRFQSFESPASSQNDFDCATSSTQVEVRELEKTFLGIPEIPTQGDENVNFNDVSKVNEEIASQPSTADNDLSMSFETPPLSEELEVIEIDSQKNNISRYSKKISADLNSIREMATAEEEAQDDLKLKKKSRKLKLRFKEKIDPSKNKNAEAELETEIKKEMFSEMEVLGQFNLGFIIAKLNNDLFIVDQHASDEKYNFEDLEKNTKLQTQPLVVPEKLELTAIQEMTLIENLAVFELNGFKFIIDETAEAGKKIKIHSKPFSKNWEFGKDDIEEMIFMLDDTPNGVCRPSRIRTMLASRACRKSVMIGDPLTKKQMKKLLGHMGELDHPWVSFITSIASVGQLKPSCLSELSSWSTNPSLFAKSGLHRRHRSLNVQMKFKRKIKFTWDQTLSKAANLKTFSIPSMAANLNHFDDISDFLFI